MATEILIRFIAGGLVVCIFAIIGEVVRPQSLAGIFGGAPSVALATLGLTFATEGGSVMATEARSMILGAIALVVYSLLVGRLLVTQQSKAIIIGPIAWLVWLVVALGLWEITLR